MVEAKNLTKTFDIRAALDGVDLTVRSGSVFGLVGSNGSGKSTLLRLVAGVYYPDGGEILVDGQPTFDNIAVKSRVFFLPDNPYFVHRATVNEAAAFYRRFYPRFSDECYRYLQTVFPIDVRMRIAGMSKGMQRQAALMLALSCMPDVLLLDEAFDGLDPVIRAVLKKLLAQAMVDRGLTVIIASHNLRELEDLCDSVGLLHNGKVLLNNDLDTLKNRLHKVQAAFAALPDPAFLRELDCLKVESQGNVLNLVLRGDADEIESRIRALNPVFMEMLRPTLEEIFIGELGAIGYDIRTILH